MNNRKAKTSFLTRLKKRRVMVIGLVLLVLLVGGFGWTKWNNQEPTGSGNTTPPLEEPSINIEPATDQEKQETEAHKRSLAEDVTTTPPATPSGKKKVTPVITSADNNSVRGYVSGIIEDNGTCAFIFSRSGSQTKTVTSEGFADATTTVCKPVNTSGLNLVAGQWSIVLSYSSSKAEGKSQSMTFEVQ